MHFYIKWEETLSLTFLFYFIFSQKEFEDLLTRTSRQTTTLSQFIFNELKYREALCASTSKNPFIIN